MAGSSSSTPRPGRILIVDDDPGIRNAMACVLRGALHTVDEAGSGTVARQRLTDGGYDAAVVDVELSDGSGVDLLAVIRDRSPATAVIFVTAHASLSTAVRALDQGAFAYLVEPVEPGQLLTTLHQALEHQALVRALLESEVRHRLITENIGEAIFLLDGEHRVVFANRRAEGLTGRSMAELRGCPWVSLLGPDSLPPAGAAPSALEREDDQPEPLETRVVRRNGGAIWVEARCSDVLEEGRVVGRLVFVRDVSQQRRAEEESRRRRREAEALADVSRLLGQSLDVNEVGQRIVDSVRDQLGAVAATLFQIDPVSGDLVILSVAGSVGRGWARGVIVPEGTSVSGIAVRERRPVVTDDALEDPAFEPPPDIRPRLEGAGYRAMLSVPLLVRDRLVGALGVGRPAGQTFHREEVRLAEAFAAQAALALDNARLFEEQKRLLDEALRLQQEAVGRARQQAAVADLGRWSLATDDLDALMSEAVAVVRQTLDVEYCQVLERSPEGSGLLLRAGLGGPADRVDPTIIPAGLDSQEGYTLLQDEPVVIEDLRTERRFRSRRLLDPYQVVSGVTVPVRTAHGSVGVLGAHTTRHRRFCDDDVRFLRSVANLLSSAMERRRVEDAIRESEAKFRALAEMAPAAIFLYRGSRLSWINARAEALTGYPRGELASMDFLQLVHPEFRGAVAGQVEAGASGQATDQYEVKIVTRQGEDRWVHLGMSTVPVNGKPAGLGVAVDVTDRVLAEEAIRRRAERLAILREIDQAILAAGSPDAIAAAALRRIRRLVPCRRATVALFELEAGEASLLAVDDPGQPAVRTGSRVPLAELGELDDLRAGIVRQVEDVIAVQTFHRLQAEGLRSYIAAPLLSRGVLIGTLNLWRQSAGRFTTEEVEIAREIGTSLAVAIQHSRLFAEVVVAREELRALSGRLVEIQEAERRHVARELHDEIGQLLTGLRFSLDRDPGGDGLDAARRLTDDLIARVRELSLDLRPAMLDHLGLLPAIVWQIDRYSGQTGVRVAFEHRGLAGVRFAPELETAAYRVLQEALTNVARHAGVAEVRVRAWADPETLFIQIDDGGRGFDVGAPRAGSGVTGMQERARLLEGQVTIDSTPGFGTCVTAEFPLTGGRGAPEGRP